MTDSASARGSIGSWFAKIEGERLPCVHRHWCVPKPFSYNDPWMIRGRRQVDEFVDHILKHKRVVLCEDDVTNNPGAAPNFDRKYYVAIFAVDNVVCDATGLRFDFAKPEKDLC